MLLSKFAMASGPGIVPGSTPQRDAWLTTVSPAHITFPIHFQWENNHLKMAVKTTAQSHKKKAVKHIKTKQNKTNRETQPPLTTEK